MKLVTVISLTIALAATSSTALAREDHKKGHVQADRHESQHQKRKQHKQKAIVQQRHKLHHVKQQHRKASHISRHKYLHPARHSWRHSRYYGWHYPNRHRLRYRYDYYPSVLGASLIGTVIGHHLYHLHDGAICYDRHTGHHDNLEHKDNPSSGYSETVGCHRVEQLTDGTERRVEVPLSECD